MENKEVKTVEIESTTTAELDAVDVEILECSMTQRC